MDSTKFLVLLQCLFLYSTCTLAWVSSRNTPAASTKRPWSGFSVSSKSRASTCTGRSTTLFESSLPTTPILPVVVDEPQQGQQPFLIKGIAAAGISKAELNLFEQAFTRACQEQQLGVCRLDNVTLLDDPASDSIPGSTGRVLLLSLSIPTTTTTKTRPNMSTKDDVIENIIAILSHEIDMMLFQSELSQPVLLVMEVEPITMTNYSRHLNHFVARTVETYEMAVPLSKQSTQSEQQRHGFTPTFSIELDGAMVVDASTGESFWDTSSVLVFDNIMTNNLRQGLLDVVLGRDDFDNDPWWDCSKDGPDPRRWVRGGLIDVPNQVGQPCWGLSDDAIDDLCLHHDAFQEFETIVSSMFPSVTVCRLPEAVLGGSVSPMTANAPTYGDTFAYHIDGDPNMAPPSPWTDVYGRYPNRQSGKPRFMSCLVYLNEEWKEEWGAPTRFVDVATNTSYDIQAKPGRCVVMDQDITHMVVAPDDKAGKRPRYSLVWKLVLHPKVHNQDMSLHGNNWPHPVLLGSANK